MYKITPQVRFHTNFDHHPFPPTIVRTIWIPLGVFKKTYMPFDIRVVLERRIYILLNFTSIGFNLRGNEKSLWQTTCVHEYRRN